LFAVIRRQARQGERRNARRQPARDRACFLSIGRPELAQDVGDVVLGGSRADYELAGDLAVREAAGYECQHLCLAFRKTKALPFAHHSLAQIVLRVLRRGLRAGCEVREHRCQ
jgi:hypothetical protein